MQHFYISRAFDVITALQFPSHAEIYAQPNLENAAK